MLAPPAAVTCPHCRTTFTPPRLPSGQLDTRLAARKLACPKCLKPVRLLAG